MFLDVATSLAVDKRQAVGELGALIKIVVPLALVTFSCQMHFWVFLHVLSAVPPVEKLGFVFSLEYNDLVSAISIYIQTIRAISWFLGIWKVGGHSHHGRHVTRNDGIGVIGCGISK